jgi:hypothetical protein
MLAAFLLTAESVQAQSVNDEINALESELTQLKEQQIELKKEATAAAAAMPSFSYRPGNGVNIEAAENHGRSVIRWKYIYAIISSSATKGAAMGS